MSRHINIRMKKKKETAEAKRLRFAREWAHQRDISNWLASRFDGRPSVSIRIDLQAARVERGVFLTIDEHQATKLANRLRNEINQFVFGNAARRHGKQLPVTIAFHQEPQPHLHILVGQSDRFTLAELSKFVEHFCTRNSWVKSSFYCEETRSIGAAQMYNSRHGADSVVTF